MALDRTDGRRSSGLVQLEHFLDPLPGGRTRLIVRGRASSHWLDLARATPPAAHRRIFIEGAYAVLARLPRPLLIGFVAWAIASWKRGICEVFNVAARLLRHDVY